ncbi:MAG: SpoIIE family protein phosphatase, partial [Leptospiraceae bacterium]|nr:SpoIIE family protein phosphatase [Leptospiraceae bacterium]
PATESTSDSRTGAAISAIHGDRRIAERPVFSAYEVGKACIARADIFRTHSIDSIPGDSTIAEVYEMYNHRPALDFLPVIGNHNRIVGYIRRQSLLAALSASTFARELLLRPDRTILELMDRRAVILDAHTRLSDATNILMQRTDDIRFDPFIVSLDGKYFGISTVRRVLDNLNRYFQLDLDHCRDAQMHLMDARMDRVEARTQYEARVIPQHGPGGDFAGVFEINEELALGALFDVCGKGIKAAHMVTALGSSLLAMLDFSAHQPLDFRSFELARRARQINRILCGVTPEDMYATGVLFLIDKRRKLMQLLDFGHGLMWLKRQNRIYRLGEQNTDHYGMLSFYGINPELEPICRTYRLQSGDVLFTCSDGLTEARTHDRSELGTESVIKTLMRTVRPDAVVAGMERLWSDFRAGYHQTDDLSLLTVWMP